MRQRLRQLFGSGVFALQSHLETVVFDLCGVQVGDVQVVIETSFEFELGEKIFAVKNV